jgi:DNA modification methylase
MEVLINGDARQIPLADESVHCVVTSPPYWGLRDYGTAVWVGGDPECDHKVGRFEYPVSDKQKSNSGSAGHQAKGKCPKCGAFREDGQIGMQSSHLQYVEDMVMIGREIWRVLRDDGTFWLNLGDSYNGSGGPGSQYDRKAARGYKGEFRKYKNPNRKSVGLKPKDLVGIPWRVALALQEDGWYLRSDIIWNKTNPMPESVRDRPTKSHEYIFLLTKNKKYFYDAEAIKEPQAEISVRRAFSKNNVDQRKDANSDVYAISGKSQDKTYERLRERIEAGEVPMRNKRTVWTFSTRPYKGAHFAVFPPDLPEMCIKAGTSERGVCPKCGRSWERVVNNPKIPDELRNRGADTKWNFNPTQVGGGQKIQDWRDKNPPMTVGWKPTCNHYDGLYRTEFQRTRSTRKLYQQNARDDWWPRVRERAGLEHWPIVSCTVLDPFVGSGTTLLVAEELGRNGIGIDLSYDYLYNQARKRLGL